MEIMRAQLLPVLAVVSAAGSAPVSPAAARVEASRVTARVPVTVVSPAAANVDESRVTARVPVEPDSTSPDAARVLSARVTARVPVTVVVPDAASVLSARVAARVPVTVVVPDAANVDESRVTARVPVEPLGATAVAVTVVAVQLPTGYSMVCASSALSGSGTEPKSTRSVPDVEVPVMTVTGPK